MLPISDFVNRVIWGDSAKVLASMPTASMDLVVTDPPYGARYRVRSGRRVANDADLSWLKPTFRELYRVLRPDAFCVSFYGWPRVEEFALAQKAAGFRPVGHFVYVKRYASNARYVEYRHESAFLLRKGNPVPHEILPDVLPWHYTGNRRHPTEKPLSAIRPFIAAYSKPGDIVLDPFAGSGTTAVAAAEAGRRYVAIELESRYCAVALARLRSAKVEKTNQPKLT